MRVLITGCDGFLGSNLIRILSNLNHELIGTSIEDAKINNIKFIQGDLLNLDFVKSLIKSSNPDIIINTAALPDVDFCDKDPEKAYKINVLTAINVAKSIDRKDTKLIHISTDQLFNGKKSFYSEDDTTEPLNVYGKTKSMAEKACLENHMNTLIVRTNFFGRSLNNHKPTFAEWIINSLNHKQEINMFNDLFFTPIEVSYLVKAIEKTFKSKYTGILNIVGKERISKYDY